MIYQYPHEFVGIIDKLLLNVNLFTMKNSIKSQKADQFFIFSAHVCRRPSGLAGPTKLI